MGALPQRGRMIDVGGRRLRLVAAGPAPDDAAAATPTVLLESGAFGFSADWGVVQDRLAALGIRSLAYDRAGMGRSDPSPAPRDGHSILDDLEKLLSEAGEAPPYILVGHSMAGLRVQLFAARHPDWVKGVVLVDASTAEATETALGSTYLKVFTALSRLAARLASLNLIKPFAWAFDRIGLSGDAKTEKHWAYGHGPHGRTSAAEVEAWLETAAQARRGGAYPPQLPVAVVTAGDAPDHHPVKAMMTAPTRGHPGRTYVRHVPGARHASLLGRRFADEIVKAILFVGE
jgi:pimeloyl-ACP methyl ester carboxylesterase